MRILNRYILGVSAALALLVPSVASARDNVYRNFGYSSGYPAQRHHYYAPPVYHHYHAPPQAHYYRERCPPPRRHHSLNRHRDHWRQDYGYRDRGYHSPYGHRGYGSRSRVFVEIDD